MEDLSAQCEGLVAEGGRGRLDAQGHEGIEQWRLPTIT